MRKLGFVLAACAAVALAVPAASATAGTAGGREHHHSQLPHSHHSHQVTVTPVTSGLDSPRGLAFLRDGRLAVAEAGHGGDVCLGDMGCVGLTGKVSAVDVGTGSHHAIAHGLVSFTDPEGGAVGIDGLSAVYGRLLGIIGIYPQAAAAIDCSKVPAKDCRHVRSVAIRQAGALVTFTKHGHAWPLANVGAFDYQFTVDNPGGATYGTEQDANPYGLLAERHGTYVADAGANTLDWVDHSGHIRILYRFPVPSPAEKFPTDAVPTCVAHSGDALVVADLAGRIWRLSHHGVTMISGPTGKTYTGGDHYTGCAGDRYGNVYVVSMFHGMAPGPDVATTGSVVKVSEHGSVHPLQGASGLPFPNGITVGPDGALYVSVGSISPQGGVVRISR